MIPVTNEKAFLGLLEKVAHLKPTKDGDYYLVQPENVSVSYLYSVHRRLRLCSRSQTKGALESGKLIPPSVLFANGPNGWRTMGIFASIRFPTNTRNCSGNR